MKYLQYDSQNVGTDGQETLGQWVSLLYDLVMSQPWFANFFY